MTLEEYLKETTDSPTMGLRLYNTATRKKESFAPIHPHEVGMYVCGPTVNDVPHLGHARQQIVFDTLRKFLRFSGYKVTYVSNITDVDDKIINKARELGEDVATLTERNIAKHREDYARIGVEAPDVQPRATEYIQQMIDLVQQLEKKGFAYVLPGDGVYYDISQFKEYGKLARQDRESRIAGVRVDANSEKKNKEDFVLWKFSKPNEPKWNSPWGDGRPGWHIECSAMSSSILGLPFDIHGGGQDLIFPHHEDEIAQTEAAFGKKVANYWVHNGMVIIDKVKMSKSLGNFKTIRDLLDKYTGETVRYFVISSHYRKPVDFNSTSLDDADNSYKRLKSLVDRLEDDGQRNQEYLSKFKASLDDDLNTPNALAVLWKLAKDETAPGKYQTIASMDEVLGLNLLQKKTEEPIPEDILTLVSEREKARRNKDWAQADVLRKDISSRGFSINDGPDGPRVIAKKNE